MAAATSWWLHASHRRIVVKPWAKDANHTPLFECDASALGGTSSLALISPSLFAAHDSGVRPLNRYFVLCVNIKSFPYLTGPRPWPHVHSPQSTIATPGQSRYLDVSPATQHMPDWLRLGRCRENRCAKSHTLTEIYILLRKDLSS